MRLLYLHGFASGPRSYKGVKLQERFATRGIAVELPSLRLPSFERPRVSIMIDAITQSLRERDERAVLIGSSLGGLVAAHVALRTERVAALVLLAPAFGMAQRWRDRLGDEGLAKWRQNEWLPVFDFAEKRDAGIDIGFLDDALALLPELPQPRCPITIVHGSHDDVVPVAQSETFVAAVPHARLTIVDDGHELGHSLDTIEHETTAVLSTLSAT